MGWAENLAACHRWVSANLRMPCHVWTLCCQSDKNEGHQRQINSGTPSSASFSNTTTWSTWSNAFVKSINKARTDCIFTACHNARIASAVLATAIPSVRLSVCLSIRLSHAGIVSKRQHVAWCSLHCQIAKCVLFSRNQKIFRRDDPLPPEILAQTDLPPPEGREFWHILPCSASIVRDRKRSSITLNKNSTPAFQWAINQGYTLPLTPSKWGSNCVNALPAITGKALAKILAAS